jgi:hypothetical protein
MPEKATVDRAKRDLRQGKSKSTAAGEFVREEMHHIREGKHGARSAKQAIAIGLSKARRAGIGLAPPARGKAKTSTRKAAARDNATGRGTRKPRSHSPARARAASRALRREPRRAASHTALARHASTAAAKRTRADRSRSARKAAATKGPAVRRAAAKKAARTRARHASK